jgi:hypothetical protein
MFCALLNEAAIAAEKNLQILHTPLNRPIQGGNKKREYTMDQKENKRFDKLYQRHLQMLKLQGKSEKTRDAYVA